MVPIYEVGVTGRWSIRRGKDPTMSQKCHTWSDNWRKKERKDK